MDVDSRLPPRTAAIDQALHVCGAVGESGIEKIAAQESFTKRVIRVGLVWSA
jgi:hypothetical protein